MTPAEILTRLSALEAIMSAPDVSDTAWAVAWGEREDLRAMLAKMEEA